MIEGIIFDFNRTLFDPEKKQLFEDVFAFLEKLSKKYKLALISFATRVPERKKIIHSLSLEKYFYKVLVASEKKPKHFKDCAKALDCKLNEILVLGDRVKSEIKIANKLGMISVWLKKGKFASELPETPEEEPNFTISSLLETEKVLSKLNKKL